MMARASKAEVVPAVPVLVEYLVTEIDVNLNTDEIMSVLISSAT
jgi:hypothetical protein